MLAKIIYIPVVIITFSSFGACIRNENLIDVERQSFRAITFFPDDNDFISVEPRQQYNVRDASEESKFAFPGKQQDNSYNVNEIPTDNANTYAKPHTNILRGNPHDSAFNTGEHHRAISNSDYNYTPNPNYPNTIYAANGNGRDVPKYRAYNDPNYPGSNYAQNFGYFPGNRPSINRIPNYSGRPVHPAAFHRYQYQSEAPRPGSFVPPPPLPPPAVSYPPLYGSPGADAFQIPFGNPLLNFFNNFRTPSGQFTKALEDIARNDDLQCISKLLCQTVGDPSRRKHFPEFISNPMFATLIASLPASSPTLTFGRAALLGVTGGVSSCHHTFSKCPQNEDHLLYYLNNHKGGFFRFFNGGTQFENAGQSYPVVHQQQYPQNNQHYNDKPGTSSTDEGALNNLGFLGDLAALFTSGAQLANYKKIGGGISNLLSDFMGNTFSGRNKRSVAVLDDLSTNDTTRAEETTEEDDVSETRENAKEKFNHTTEISGNEDLEIEGRILNKKIYSDYFEHHDDKVIFPSEDDQLNGYRGQKGVTFNEFEDEYPSRYENEKYRYRKGKRVNFEDVFNYAPHFPFKTDQDESNYRDRMIFPDRRGTGNLRFDSNQFHANRNRYEEYNKNPYRDYDRDYHRDGNSDHNRDRDEDYDRDRNRYNNRYGKILNRPVYNRDYYKDDYSSNSGRPYYSESSKYDLHNSNKYDNDRKGYPPSYSSSYYTNRHTTERPYSQNYYVTPRPTDNRDYYRDEYTTQRPHINNNYYTSRPAYDRDYYTTRYTTPKPRDPDRNVYITNSKGIVDHYITPEGTKVYV